MFLNYELMSVFYYDKHLFFKLTSFSLLCLARGQPGVKSINTTSWCAENQNEDEALCRRLFFVKWPAELTLSLNPKALKSLLSLDRKSVV